MMKLLLIFLAFTLLLVIDVATSQKENMYDCEGVNIVTRDQWRARKAMRFRRIHLPVNHIVVLHTVTKFCRSRQQCARAVQFIQDLHLDDRGWWDIAYNFLVGGDGNIYEGRGWLNTASFAMSYNSISMGIAFIGNFNKDKPTRAMLNATQNLIRCGINKGFISPTSEIHGHRDITCTESPGDNLYALIRNWDNYKGGRLPHYYCNKLEPPEVNRDIINE